MTMGNDDGKGKQQKAPIVKCRICKGTGKVWSNLAGLIICWNCAGSGEEPSHAFDDVMRRIEESSWKEKGYW